MLSMQERTYPLLRLADAGVQGLEIVAFHQRMEDLGQLIRGCRQLPDGKVHPPAHAGDAGGALALP